MEIKALSDDFINDLIASGTSPGLLRTGRDPSDGVDTSSDVSSGVPEELTWCEFCKGYYIAEYHVERWVDGMWSGS